MADNHNTKRRRPVLNICISPSAAARLAALAAGEMRSRSNMIEALIVRASPPSVEPKEDESATRECRP